MSVTGESVSTGKVEISVSYERQEGRGSNQYAVWIEDLNGNLVKTLYVTRFTAKGGYVERPDCTPVWREKAHAPALTEAQVDAITAPTPQTGVQVYTWDGTNLNGEPVEKGNYTFVVEANLLGASRVIFTGEVALGTESTVSPAPQYTTPEESANKNMITAVTARVIP
ncbi:MAG: DUF2271 domain-containing protein [Tannerellaceae bacterium]|nr:DUF2271 domain-containing protein [Tannerellaceae bacterium]